MFFLFYTLNGWAVSSHLPNHELIQDNQTTKMPCRRSWCPLCSRLITVIINSLMISEQILGMNRYYTQPTGFLTCTKSNQKPRGFLFSMAPKVCHTMPHSGDMGTSRGWYISIKTLWHWRSLSILLACCSRQQDAWAFESFPSTNVPLDHQPVQRPKHPNKRLVSLRSSCQKNNP